MASFVPGKLIAQGALKIEEEIGTGGAGDVFLACKTSEPNTKLAVKVEKVNKQPTTLLHESSVYNILKGIPGIPKVYKFVKSDDGEYNMMYMQLLGLSLYDLMRKNGGTLSLKSVLKLSIHLIEILEQVHSKGVLHRDLKPRNIMMGCGTRKNELFIIDFGIAKVYRHPKTSEQIPFKITRYSQGTYTFASIAAHKRQELSPKDDLESIGYIIIYLLRGFLPWFTQEVSEKESMKDRWHMVQKIKEDFGKTLPCGPEFTELSTFFQYCQGLKYDQTPNYEYLKDWFKSELQKKTGTLHEDVKYEWDQ